MYDTYVRFQKLLDTSMAKVYFEEMALMYAKTKSPRIFATCFVRLYKYTTRITTLPKFAKLDNEDIVSITLQCLEQCFLDYVQKGNRLPSGKRTASFISYYTFRLHNDLMIESTHKLSLKRGRGLVLESLDYLKKEYDYDQPVYAKFDDFESYLILPNNLNEKEYLFCWGILKGILEEDVTNLQVAEFLGVSNTMVSNIKKRIRKKLGKIEV